MIRFVIYITIYALSILPAISQISAKDKLYPNTIEYALISDKQFLLPSFKFGELFSIISHFPKDIKYVKKANLPLSNWDYQNDTTLYLNKTGDAFYQEIFTKEYLEKTEIKEPDREGAWKNRSKFRVIPYETYLQSFQLIDFSSEEYEYFKKNLYSFLDLDIKIKDSLNATVYMKDHRMFMVYNVSLTDSCYTYPTDFRQEVPVSSLYPCWRDGIYYITYKEQHNGYPPFKSEDQNFIDILHKHFEENEYPPYRYIGRYMKNRTTPQGKVFDNFFFEGNFKVIYQKENTYIFNLHNGRIYIMTPNRIDCIGVISLKDYSPLRERKYIIEDRDNEEILLFGSVDWYENNHPKPKTRFITKEEIDNIYILNTHLYSH